MIHWTTWELLAATWFWDPSIFIGSTLLLLIYWKWGRPRSRRQTIFFVSGVLVMVLALVSPLETLGDTYLFSAHMLQHLLLLLVTPPLLLLGLPQAAAQRIVDEPFFGLVEGVLKRPYIAWPLGVITIWVWHIPALYNAALADEQIHILEHLLFMATAVIFWWPILAPLPASRIPPLAVIPYLFAAAAASSVLGILLTFTPPGLYPAYLYPLDELGALPLIRDGWGLSPTSDQQIGGLLMWVPGSLVYLSGIILALARWYSAPDEDNFDPTLAGAA